MAIFDPGCNANGPNDVRVTRVLHIVNTTPNVRASELARIVNLSTSRLNHLFKIETGTALAGHIRKARLEVAAQMLRSTDERIKAIAVNAGYSHTSSFVRAFRLHFEESPMSYRHRFRGPTASSGRARDGIGREN